MLNSLWSNILLKFTYSCILHLIYRFSATELAHQQPLRRAHYRSLVEWHFMRGLQSATNLLRLINSSDCHVICTATTFAFINHFARGPQRGEYLFFNEHGSLQWLPLLHETRTIIYLVGIQRITVGPLREKSLEPTPKGHKTSHYQVQVPPPRLDPSPWASTGLCSNIYLLRLSKRQGSSEEACVMLRGNVR